MKSLFLTMGIPGSGKSTYIKTAMRPEDIYISRDKIRFSLLKPNEPYFSKEKEVFRILISKTNEALKNGRGDVYVDATHLNKASRAKLLTKLTETPHEINVVFMNTSLKEAIKRNNNRTGRAKVPEKSIKEMYNSIEMPSSEEGIKYLFSINEKGISAIKDVQEDKWIIKEED